ncbi:MAG: hypothetical protein GYA30_04210 [Chloroflexi bacterium]|nr:hypothetical protein [Chloroflexota bacterium]OQA94256.1 MAG: hypothetical protein BWY25_02863 [Chloroflexi bacterium ADurb.Bin222]HOS80179.1 hypothetical protein [Anaerolineae bacterium]HQF00044.1 hypothetical protein [Anaerolineae bacterium]HQJ12472.1 hypothetical protein [Anaerolineae bacterium]
MSTTRSARWFVGVGLLLCAALFLALRGGDQPPSVSASNQYATLATVSADADLSVSPASPPAALAYDPAALLAAQIPLFPDSFMVDLPLVMK